MNTKEKKLIGGHAGFTLIELLIAALITAILAVAAFQFYVTMQQQVTSQKEISDMQQISRSCLQEISKTLRMAGYMLPEGHPAFDTISSAEIWVYIGTGDLSALDPVDTTKYYLQEFDAAQYDKVPGLAAGMKLYNLIKESEEPGWTQPEIFADYITSLSFLPIGSSEIAVTIEVQTSKKDETFNANNGFRTFVNTERVNMRNLTI
ncbi:MAG: prepilin-type N-terminal cleavage/methylation domain-containing protein [Candidatus Zixiibacteriota bacterium]|nr:MAG: prepilin-type N-terminal cleavage/methylation domain-containing protein [candidate division Zixibacteria bacterium]